MPGRLEEARGYWQQIKQPRARLPPAVGEELVRLFLAAGDFERLDELLDSLLKKRMYRARYWIAYLRAKRFLTMVPRHASTLQELLASPQGPPFRLEEAIGQQEAYLLSAMGTLNEKLTLALWLVSYGGQEVADRGLLRALSLIRQHWPVGCPLPGPDEQWTLRDDRLVRHDAPPPIRARRREKPTDSEGEATVLMEAYEYLQTVHARRSGYPATMRLEKEGGGWAHFSHEFADASSPKRFNVAWLADFYAEAQRAEHRWEELGSVNLCEEGTAAPPYRAVCTADVLLTDCETGQGQRRRSEIRLSTPTLAMERILAFMRREEILDLDAAAEQRSHVEWGTVHAWRLERLRELIRFCTRASAGLPGRDYVQVCPVYYDMTDKLAQPPAVQDELRASIAFASQRNSDLIATFAEDERARSAGLDKVRLYWIWVDRSQKGPAHPHSFLQRIFWPDRSVGKLASPR